jgi:hypothetical protein
MGGWDILSLIRFRLIRENAVVEVNIATLRLPSSEIQRHVVR